MLRRVQMSRKPRCVRIGHAAPALPVWAAAVVVIGAMGHVQFETRSDETGHAQAALGDKSRGWQEVRVGPPAPHLLLFGSRLFSRCSPRPSAAWDPPQHDAHRSRWP